MHGKHDNNNIKNEKLRMDIITCVNVEEWRRKEGDQRKNCEECGLRGELRE